MQTFRVGLLLALQFFTVIPVRKELPMSQRTITSMFLFLPWVGALLGAGVAFLLFALQTWTTFSSLLIAFTLLFAYVFFTGGLHLDGWVDTSDAFFSYRDVAKRHDILDDPRIGAFGAMSLLFLVLAKLIILMELLQKDVNLLLWCITIPFLSRAGMSLYFYWTKSAKEKGLAYFFQQRYHPKVYVVGTLTSIVVMTTVVSMFCNMMWLLSVLLVVTIVGSFLYKKWSTKHFNGSSGDLLGAFIEGMEVVLWLSLLLFN